MVRTLGKFSRQVPPGLHYHLPYPFQTVVKPKVTELRRIEIGFRTLYPGPPPHHQLFPEESLMLTGDENIVDCQYIVQYRISDPYASCFLFAMQKMRYEMRPKLLCEKWWAKKALMRCSP